MVQWITSIVETMGYFGIALLMFLENVFPPIPSELIMPLGGFVTGREDASMTFVGVVVAGTVGSVLGQVPLYYLGRALGRRRLMRLTDRYGRWVLVTGEDIERAIAWFDRHGGATVFFCRLVPGVRSLISVPAGINHFNMLAFLAYSTLGMGIWAAVLAYAGRLLGSNYDRIEGYLGPVSYAVFGLIALAMVVWIGRRWIKLNLGQRDPSNPTGHADAPLESETFPEAEPTEDR